MRGLRGGAVTAAWRIALGFVLEDVTANPFLSDEELCRRQGALPGNKELRRALGYPSVREARVAAYCRLLRAGEVPGDSWAPEVLDAARELMAA